MDETATPRFAQGVRLREDKVRNAWVVLAPERLFMPDEHALAILHRVDGIRTAATIIDALATQFDAPRAIIATDVLAMLADLTAKGVITS